MIITCGEALIDFMPRNTASGAVSFEPLPGGSIANVAIALGRLGAPAGFFGGLSTDMFGDVLRNHLATSGVDLSLVDTSDRPTTLAFVSLENGSARYAFFDENSAGRMVTAAHLSALPDNVSALHFGSFSLAAEPCGTTYEALMEREHARRVISLDINVRPTLIDDRNSYLERIGRLVAMSDIVKLSDEDYDWLEPDGDFDSTAARWLNAGARIVAMTRGPDGATAYTARGKTSVPGVATLVADTVGAGDTFTAGMLAHLHDGGLLDKQRIAGLGEADLSSALEFAAKAAAITVSRAGANPPWKSELA